jgi:hypothetical protein
MSRNTDVFQVLIPKVATVVGAGTTLDALPIGALAAFDYDTNLSVVAAVRDYYYAVKVLDNNGVADIIKSAGTHIQQKNEVSLTQQCYVAPVDKVIQLSGWTAECNTEYMLKFEIRNQEAYRLNGYNQVIKAYTTVSPDCIDCNTDCPNGNCFQVAHDLMTQINDDEDAVFEAVAVIEEGTYTVTTAAITANGNITVTTDGNAVVVAVLQADTLAEIATKIAAAINADGTHVAFINAVAPTVVNIVGAPLASVLVFADTEVTGAVVGVTAVASTELTDISILVGPVAAYNLANPTAQIACPTLNFSVNPMTFSTFCDINLNYFFPRQTDAALVGLIGFEGNSTIAVVTEMVYEEGSGYDVKQLEYVAGGWNGKTGPYRVFSDGLAQTGFQYFADQSAKYDLIHLSYDQESISGWRQDIAFERTIFASNIDASQAISTMVSDLVSAMAGTNIDDLVNCP